MGAASGMAGGRLLTGGGLHAGGAAGSAGMWERAAQHRGQGAEGEAPDWGGGSGSSSVVAHDCVWRKVGGWAGQAAVRRL